MRVICALACWAVALECASKAFGIDAQVIFSADYVGTWIVPAVCWGVAGFDVLMNGAK
jgi:hypothetical protein